MPTLVAAFLYFNLAFMVWLLLGALTVDIAAVRSLRRQGFEHRSDS